MPLEGAPLSASGRKLGKSPQTSSDEGAPQKWMLLHIDQLSTMLSDLLCPCCSQDTVSSVIMEEGKKGFATKIKLMCRDCPFTKIVMSSTRESDTEKKFPAFEVNRLMSLFNFRVGPGHRAQEKFRVTFGMSGMAPSALKRHEKRLKEAVIEEGTEVLTRAAAAVRAAHAEENPALKNALDAGETPQIDICVSFDGTWHKRGFTSLHGVGACIEITTGLVVDTHVLSIYCHACKQQESKGLSADEMEAWKADHAQDCCKNHEGTSKSMEMEAAKVMWGRSVAKHNFRYVEMLCDGDSSAYSAVLQSAPYAVEKLDCVNHASKRMGTALRQKAKEEGLGGGKRPGQLTQAKCKKLQDYYHGAITNKRNQEDLDAMRASIWSAFFHSISTDQAHYHHRCPQPAQGKRSWCFYQQALAEGKEPPPHSEHMTQTFLNHEVAEKVRHVYDRMSNLNLLKRLKSGQTQNANESFHSTIWLRCPKTMFVGRKRVEAAVAEAVGVFNEGSKAMTNLLGKLYMEASRVSLDALEKADKLRVKKAEARASEQAKGKRKSQAVTQKAERKRKRRQEGETYEAGKL